MRLEEHTVSRTQLMCNKGGGDGVHELFPCTSVMRDWYKAQAMGPFLSWCQAEQSKFRGWNYPVWPQADASLVEQ